MRTGNWKDKFVKKAIGKLESLSHPYEFTIPLRDDIFVHFAPLENLRQIQQDGFIDASKVSWGKQDRNYGVSLEYGYFLPTYQIDSEKFFAQDEEFMKNLYALVFMTDSIPEKAETHEVMWRGPVKILNSEIIPWEKAKEYLDKSQIPKELSDIYRHKIKIKHDQTHDLTSNIDLHNVYELLYRNGLSHLLSSWSMFGDNVSYEKLKKSTNQQELSFIIENKDFIENNRAIIREEVLKTYRGRQVRLSQLIEMIKELISMNQ